MAGTSYKGSEIKSVDQFIRIEPWTIHPQCADAAVLQDGAQAIGVILIGVRQYDMINVRSGEELLDVINDRLTGIEVPAIDDVHLGRAVD